MCETEQAKSKEQMRKDVEELQRVQNQQVQLLRDQSEKLQIEMNKKIEELKGELDASRKTIDKQAKSIDELVASKKLLEEENKSMKGEIGKMKEEIVGMKGELDASRKTVDKQAKSIDELVASKKILEEENKSVKGEIGKMKEELVGMKNESGKLAKDMKSINEKSDEVKKQMSAESRKLKDVIEVIEKKRKTVKYDGKEQNRFNGIMKWLGKGDASNSLSNKIVDVTSSSVISENPDLQLKNVLNYGDDKQVFQSDSEPNPWLCIDFKEHRVNPTHYSIRSHGFAGKGNYHPQSWDVEGSNDSVSWAALDSRREEKSLDGRAASNTFEITNEANKSKYFRYLRIIQKGVNTHNDNSLAFSSIEFFGYIEKQ